MPEPGQGIQANLTGRVSRPSITVIATASASTKTPDVASPAKAALCRAASMLS